MVRLAALSYSFQQVDYRTLTGPFYTLQKIRSVSKPPKPISHYSSVQIYVNHKEKTFSDFLISRETNYLEEVNSN